MVQSTILKEIPRIKILDFALSVKGDVAPILKDNFKEHQITTGLFICFVLSVLKDNFKEHQITTKPLWYNCPSILKDNFKEHQITTDQGRGNYKDN